MDTPTPTTGSSKDSMSPRAEARTHGQKTYESRPCKLGHILRYTVNGSCVECQKLSKQAQTEYRALYWRSWYYRNLKHARALGLKSTNLYNIRHSDRKSKSQAHTQAKWRNTFDVLYYRG